MIYIQGTHVAIDVIGMGDFPDETCRTMILNAIYNGDQWDIYIYMYIYVCIDRQLDKGHINSCQTNGMNVDLLSGT